MYIVNKEAFVQDWIMFLGLHSRMGTQHAKLMKQVGDLKQGNYKVYLNQLTLDIENYRKQCTEYGYPENQDIPVEGYMVSKMCAINNEMCKNT